MKLIFLGTSGFAIPALRAVSHMTAAVVSRPDRPAGRGRKLRKPPAAQEALELGLPLLQPEKLSEIRDFVKETGPEVMVSASYGGWLPGWFLESARLGVVNIHPSLLPRHRGAAPVIRAVLQGDQVTGVSFMVTDGGWDTGDLLKAFEHPIGDSVTSGDLEAELAELAAEKLGEVLIAYGNGELTPRPQEGMETYAEKVSPSESEIDWRLPAEQVDRMVRAFNPVPGARTAFQGRMVKIHQGEPADRIGPPGEVLDLDPLSVACGTGSLVISELQPRGKRRMTGGDFTRGYRVEKGNRFG